MFFLDWTRNENFFQAILCWEESSFGWRMIINTSLLRGIEFNMKHCRFRDTYFKTMAPLRVAACRSMLSTPVPARPTTRRFGQAANTSAVTFVSERTMRASWFCSMERNVHYWKGFISGIISTEILILYLCKRVSVKIPLLYAVQLQIYLGTRLNSERETYPRKNGPAGSHTFLFPR
jgi:hypothetical protein